MCLLSKIKDGSEKHEKKLKWEDDIWILCWIHLLSEDVGEDGPDGEDQDDEGV